MANLRSSKKDSRRNAKRREANSDKKATLRTYKKNILKFISEGNKDEAEKAFNIYTTLIDKAAKVNIVHSNNASRNKSRVALKINALSKA